MAADRSFLLLQQHIEFVPAFFDVLGRSIGPFGFLFHMVDFEGQNRKSVNGPGGALGIDSSILLNSTEWYFFEEIVCQCFLLNR